MRNLAATLAVVGALLFGAGSAWADWDDGLVAAQRGDYATALQEWRPLAEQGHATAQYRLGIMYDHGMGVPENDTEAVKWYRMAAEQGDVEAQISLSVMYLNGTGVPVNKVKGYMWFSLAKAQGHEKAAEGLEIVRKAMTLADISKAQTLAAEMWEKINN